MGSFQQVFFTEAGGQNAEGLPPLISVVVRDMLKKVPGLPVEIFSWCKLHGDGLGIPNLPC